MAKRKSLVAKLYQVHKKSKEARDRAERQAHRAFETEQNRLVREMEADEKRRLREEERLAKERIRQAEQQERERLKQEAQRDRDHVRLTAEQCRAEAEARTAAVRTRIEELDQLLIERTRDLRIRSREAEDAFNSGGPLALVDVIHEVLGTSIYPEGPQRAHGTHRRAQPQGNAARASRTRRPDRPAQTPTRLGTTRRHITDSNR